MTNWKDEQAGKHKPTKGRKKSEKSTKGWKKVQTVQNCISNLKQAKDGTPSSKQGEDTAKLREKGITIHIRARKEPAQEVAQLTGAQEPEVECESVPEKPRVERRASRAVKKRLSLVELLKNVSNNLRIFFIVIVFLVRFEKSC